MNKFNIKIEEILTFIFIALITMMFVGTIKLSANTLQASEETDAAYVELTPEIIEVVELTPAPTPTNETTALIENSAQEELVEDEKIIQDVLIEEEIISSQEEEPLIQEELNEDGAEINSATEEVPKINEIEVECPYHVEIIANIPVGAVVHEGDIIILTAVLYGFDGLEVSYQWHVLEGDWVPIEGATAQSYSFAANEENVSCWYNVCVTIIEEEEA